MRDNEKFLNKKSVRAIISGSVIALVLIILMFVICSFAILNMTSFPHKLIVYIICGILAIGGFAGGYITGRINKSSGILYGVTTGIVIFFIVFLAGLSSVLSGFTLFTILKLAILVISSAIGGILGVNKKEKLHIK